MLKNFKCKRCGACCYPPRLYYSDIKRIKKAGYNEEDF
ncbi:YkgJ family cysteine cluster protein, partial [Candidatus Woesearchaeota archaeon]|nr:YkgJ family cysteine cluster protein [Candidatus Woesearchaeota archaeon]